MERIHVVGVGPRTGTTLMAECISACFAIDASEPHEARLTRHRWNVGVYLTKYPAEIALVAPRLRLDRHFHVVCMIRDPRDVVVSVHGRDQRRYWAPLRLWLKQAANLRRLLGSERFILVRYEDLVARPDDVQAELARRLPFLKKTAVFSRYHEVAAPSKDSLVALGGIRPIGTESIGNWRNHLPRLKGQIARHGSIADDLVEFGYETDNGWLTHLDGVKPDMRRSHWPEESRQGSQRWRYARAWLDALSIAGLRMVGARIV